VKDVRTWETNTVSDTKIHLAFYLGDQTPILIATQDRKENCCPLSGEG
jgi:hypothetical protein